MLSAGCICTFVNTLSHPVTGTVQQQIKIEGLRNQRPGVQRRLAGGHVSDHVCSVHARRNSRLSRPVWMASICLSGCPRSAGCCRGHQLGQIGLKLAPQHTGARSRIRIRNRQNGVRREIMGRGLAARIVLPPGLSRRTFPAIPDVPCCCCTPGARVI